MDGYQDTGVFNLFDEEYYLASEARGRVESENLGQFRLQVEMHQFILFLIFSVLMTGWLAAVHQYHRSS